MICITLHSFVLHSLPISSSSTLSYNYTWRRVQINLIVVVPIWRRPSIFTMLQCGNLVLLTMRFLDVAKFTVLTSLPLKIARKLFSPYKIWVFSAVTMKNGVFWDIKPQFVPHKKHITSPLQSPTDLCYVRFEVFWVVTVQNAVFLNMTPTCHRNVSPPSSRLQKSAN
jgi:hypothetical protein